MCMKHAMRHGRDPGRKMTFSCHLGWPLTVRAVNGAPTVRAVNGTPNVRVVNGTPTVRVCDGQEIATAGRSAKSTRGVGSGSQRQR